MVNLTFLAGGYDMFIATYLFNTDASSLSVVARSQTGPNPSWLSLHPANRSILYTVNEAGPGALQSFIVNPGGTLSSAIDTTSSGGDSPAHIVALSSNSNANNIAVMNYSGGNGRIIPTTSFTKFNITSPSGSVITFPRKSGNGGALAPSHPHQAVEYQGEVLIPDLGGDTIWRLAKQNERWNIIGEVLQPKGSGPRHIAIYDNRLFTLHELSSTMTVQPLPLPSPGSSTNQLPIISNVSIIPSTTPPGSSYAAAEILIPPPNTRFPASGSTPYIYVSNRNVGTPDYSSNQGDSIAIFELLDRGTSSERLSLVRQVYTGLSQVRGMAFSDLVTVGTTQEQYLVAAGVAGSGGVVVLKRTEGGRNLEVVARNWEIQTRTSFVWL
ncbi:hypothetical protein AX16_002471 [Volvariella volvacea WC 439]|nr:hypothetical protein AX16_002471 [Volvariella volvacea WC 439]